MTTDTSPAATAAGRADGAMLTVDDLHVYYGNIAAVNGLTMAVRPGEIVTLIGSNGAGKSTTLRTVSGLLHARRGTVTFKGKDISRLAGHQVVAAGITHSPEGRQTAARSYREAYQKYRKMSEAVLDSEPIPLGHRQTIRRYFELIRPQNSDTADKPAAAEATP